MAASLSKTKKNNIKTADDISLLIDRLPANPMFTNEETGEHFQLGQVISTPFNPENFIYDGSTIGTKLNGLLELAKDVADDDRYQVDFKLRTNIGPDFTFLLTQVHRHGERKA